MKTDGIDDLLDAYPEVKFLVGSGYSGLANDRPDQRFTGRRELLPEIIRAVTGLASDRAAAR